MSTRIREDANTRSLLVGFVIASIVNIVAQGTGVFAFSLITKPFIMLLLFCWAWQVLPKPKPRGGKLLLVGMLFAWAGDMFLLFATRDASGQSMFMLGIAGFFVMQVFYIWAFLSVPGPHMLAKAPLLLIPFVAYWGLMNMIMDPGMMRIPVLLYSVVLVGMSVAALDLVPRLPAPYGWTVFVGSVVFVVSDSLIAINAFGSFDIGRWQGVAVMSTYVVAQYLIVTSFVRGLNLREERADEPMPVPATTTA